VKRHRYVSAGRIMPICATCHRLRFDDCHAATEARSFVDVMAFALAASATAAALAYFVMAAFTR